MREDDIVQVRTLRTPPTPCAAGSTASASTSRRPRGRSARRPAGPAARRVRPGGAQPVLRAAHGGLGRHADGRPTDLVRRRWRRFGAGGAGIVWAEATAVRPDGRANPRQLVIDERTVGRPGRAAVRAGGGPTPTPGGRRRPVVGLQLTHSGRWSRPDGEPRPRVAYRHPLLDGRGRRRPTTCSPTRELDDLVDDVRAGRGAGRPRPGSTSWT